MKHSPELRRHISISLWALALLMIAVYSILAGYTLFSGMEEMATYDFRLVARDFSEQYRLDPSAELPSTPYMKSYIGEEALPDWFKNNYSPEDIGHGKLTWDEVEPGRFGQNEELFFMAMAFELHDKKRFYIIEIFTEKDEIPGAFRKSEISEIMILCLGFSFIVLIMFGLRGLFKKISGPVGKLSEWADTLSTTDIDRPHPDFKFKEINQVADLIQNSVQGLNRALEREHQFLRFASHELRTPIAVLRTNLDLLDRLRKAPGADEKESYQRIRRAVDNMHRMTETLLWLSRKEEQMPAPDSVDITGMVRELVQENQYLLAGKDVELDLALSQVQTIIPHTAVRIVLGNLIRNAFQHTVHGRVEIRLDDGAFCIKNSGTGPYETGNDSSENGFGLGLMLVDQISKKLNLAYENQPVSGGYRAALFFDPSANRVTEH